MRIDPAGWPFVIVGLSLAASVGVYWGARAGGLLLLLPAFFLFFFRDPDRPVPSIDSAVLAPADGRVMVAGTPTAQGFAASDWHQISIFLSPLDVHVNRIPVAGRVVKVRYHAGRFLPAYRADAGDLNEYTEVTLVHDGQVIVVRQIVGILARRIVCRVKEDDVVEAGDRFGIMKFGSRMDVFLPKTAALSVRVGERVVGGVTVVAKLVEAPSA